MERYIGKNTIGSGNKMKVHLKEYERSTHDLSYVLRTTASAGTLIPFLSEVGLPGDTFDIQLDCDIMTHPTLGPLFGSFKVQLDVFQAAVRLYQGKLHQNKLKIGLNMSSVLLPVIQLWASKTPLPADHPDYENSQINPSHILAYLGIRGVGHVIDTDEDTASRLFNGIQLLMYWDVVKQYYANTQEEIGAVIHTELVPIIESTDVVQVSANGITVPFTPDMSAPVTLDNNYLVQIEFISLLGLNLPQYANQIIFNTDKGPIPFNELVMQPILEDTVFHTISQQFNIAKWGTITLFNWRIITETEMPHMAPEIATFPLDNIDKMREAILGHANVNTAFHVNDQGLTPYDWACPIGADRRQMLANQEGLALKTYQSDLFNNWIQTEWIDGPGGITAITAIDTTGGSFTLDTLNLSQKVYDMLNRIAISGGTYDDWLDTVYTHSRIVRAETPVYHGSLIKELVFQEVISNAESQGSNGNQPLGTLAGRGIMSNKHKGGKIIVKCDEIVHIMGLFSLTPRIDYSQGNKWDVGLRTMDDYHKPALDEIGFQELIQEQMAWWTTVWQGDDVDPDWHTRSLGKQPAWINYMTNVNRVLGNFAIQGNEMFMTLNRRYEVENYPVLVTDFTTYIDPRKFNQIFAQTSLDAQNFWVQIGVKITARRKMSGKLMPNL